MHHVEFQGEDVCKGNDLESRRDTAIIRLLDSGLRVAELIGIRLYDLDLEQDVALVPASAPLRRRWVASPSS